MPPNQPFLPDDGEFRRFQRDVEFFHTLTLSVEPKPCTIILKASRAQICISPQAIIQLLADKIKCPVELPYPLNDLTNPYSPLNQQKSLRDISAADLVRVDKFDKIEIEAKIACPQETGLEFPCIPGSSKSDRCPIVMRAYYLQWERTLINATIEAAKQKLEEQAAAAKHQMQKDFKIQLEADKKELKEQIEAQWREIKTLKSSNTKQENKIKQAEAEIQSSRGASYQFLEEKRKAESAVESKERELSELTKKNDIIKTENEKLETRIEELILKTNTQQQRIQQQKAAPRRDKPETTKLATSVRQRVISYLETCEEPQILSEIALALDLELNKTSEILEQLEADGEVAATEGEDGIFEYSI